MVELAICMPLSDRDPSNVVEKIWARWVVTVVLRYFECLKQEFDNDTVGRT